MDQHNEESIEMEKFDDRVLAYAMAMGANFHLREPSKDRKRFITATFVDSPRYTDRDVSHADEIAYFIVRQWPQRKVLIEKSVTNHEWTVKNSGTGATLTFSSQSESAVRERMGLAERGLKSRQLLSMDDVKERLAALDKRLNAQALESRLASKSWPPAEGSSEARALELAKAGKDFFVVMSPDSDGDGEYRKSSAKGFLDKLKDPAFHLLKLSEHASTSRFAENKWELGAGEFFADATFCAADDAAEYPLRRFFWVARPPADTEKGVKR